ncbi:leucine-rich repeat domain-containing protein, partial [bacterium]|nr:leucine-rich repeat domain-containing protein [bacterium]
EEKPVTKIGGGAFRDCASLTSITIPDSVEIIGDLAFAGCTNLPKIEVGEKNRKYTDVNGVLFDKKKTLLLNYPAGKPDTTYKIPDNVTSIRTYAFYRSLNLISVTIPDSVTSVTSDAFYRCTNLTNVTIGNGVTSIERAAFAGCTSMTSITIPDGVTSIGHGAFGWCSSLTSITFLGTAPTVDADAFKDVPDDAIALVTPKALKSFGQVGDKWNGLTLKIGSVSIVTAPKEVAAGHSDEKELILLSSHLNTVEADFPALLREREVWKIARINAQLKIDTAYLTSLKKLKTSMVQKGEIAAARAIDQAIKGGTRTDDEPTVLTKSRQVRYDALLAAMKPIDQQYWKELKKVKEDVQTLGDLERLEVVLSEITRVLAPYK